jgi:hypothetical protein
VQRVSQRKCTPFRRSGRKPGQFGNRLFVSRQSLSVCGSHSPRMIFDRCSSRSTHTRLRESPNSE